MRDWTGGERGRENNNCKNKIGYTDIPMNFLINSFECLFSLYSQTCQYYKSGIGIISIADINFVPIENRIFL